MVAKNTSRISSSKIRSPIEAVNAVGLEPTVTLKEILHAVESSISAQPRLFPNGLTKIQLQLNFPGPVGVNLLLEGPPPISVETAEVLDWNALAEARPRDQRVAEAKRLLTAGAVYPRSLSDLKPHTATSSHPEFDLHNI